MMVAFARISSSATRSIRSSVLTSVSSPNIDLSVRPRTTDGERPGRSSQGIAPGLLEMPR